MGHPALDVASIYHDALDLEAAQDVLAALRAQVDEWVDAEYVGQRRIGMRVVDGDGVEVRFRSYANLIMTAPGTNGTFTVTADPNVPEDRAYLLNNTGLVVLNPIQFERVRTTPEAQ